MLAIGKYALFMGGKHAVSASRLCGLLPEGAEACAEGGPRDLRRSPFMVTSDETSLWKERGLNLHERQRRGAVSARTQK